MRDFEFGQAVLAGFALLRRRPLATLGLALVGALATLAGHLASVVSTHFVMGAISRPDAAGMISVAANLAKILVCLVVLSIIGAAVLRDGRGRLTGHAARLFILSLLIWPALLIVLLAVGVGAIIWPLNNRGAASQDGFMFLTMGVGAIPVLVLASRLWLAGPMTVQDGRLRLMASWRLTNERPWKVFGAFIVTLLMAVAVSVFGNIAWNRLSLALKLDAALTMDSSLAATLSQMIKPIWLVQILVSGLFVGAAMVIQVAPAAYIHRRLAGDPVSDQAAVFD
jgi:hypothetical protein